MMILRACEAYRDNPSNPGTEKKFPTTLTDLVRPPFGGASFLRNGEADILDPWGNSYRYAVVTSANGDQEAYVWAERIVDGKLKLLGAKSGPAHIKSPGIPEFCDVGPRKTARFRQLRMLKCLEIQGKRIRAGRGISAIGDTDNIDVLLNDLATVRDALANDSNFSDTFLGAPAYVPALRFNDPRNSMYIGII